MHFHVRYRIELQREYARRRVLFQKVDFSQLGNISQLYQTNRIFLTLILDLVMHKDLGEFASLPSLRVYSVTSYYRTQRTFRLDPS